jgi:hypothetical protein
MLDMAGSYRPESPRSGECRDCICGIENDEGIWCLKLKKIPSPGEVESCRHFYSKTMLRKKEVDHHERDY